MWRQVLHAAVCWLTLSETFGEANKNVISSIVENISAESAPRLYRSVPVGVYASSSPYAAYSFQLPAFISAPKAAASRIIPVKQQIHEFHQNNGYLRDSYGNKFAGTPQLASYRTTFPQQYLPLQELPAHLAQPLLAAPQNKQSAPHYFVGSQYRVPTFQIVNNDARPTLSGFPQTYSYSQNLRSLVAPSNQQKQDQGVNQQQAVVEQFKEQKNEPKFQRFEYRPEETHRTEHVGVVPEQSSGDKGQIEAAAAKTPVTAIVNGKKTVINIDTEPVVPLLDLSLLEPLTFENPLVPQLQHFLPRIHDAKYQTLDEFNAANKNTKKAKTATKKKPKQQSHHQKQVPIKPVTGITEDTPEIVYEINTPNHRETYKEKSVSYNKKVEHEPETYSYNEKTEAKPVSYSYQNSEQKEPISYNVVYTSNKKPEQLTKINHEEVEQPRQLIYKFNADEAIEPNNHDEADVSGSAEDSGSAEVNDENASAYHPNQHSSNEKHNHEAPRNYQHHNDHQSSHHDGHSHGKSHPNVHHHDDRHHHNVRQQDGHPQKERQRTDRHHNDHHNGDHHHDDKPEHREKEYYQRPREEHHAPNKQYRSQDTEHHQERHPEYHSKPNQGHHHKPANDYRQAQRQVYHHEPNKERHDKPNQEYNHKPNQNHHQNSNQEYHHRPKEQRHYEAETHRSQEDSAPIRIPDTPTEVLSHPQEHEEDIRLLPPQHNAPIKVDPDQHVQEPKSHQSQQSSAENEEQSQPLFNSGTPIIQEQGKRIIIQEESPEELHMHQEQIRAEVIDQEDNNEDDFEKAYKNAAYGFPAFEKKSENIEKDIYNPASYGYSRDNEEFRVDKINPFQQYQAEGDSFPRSSRLNYNKAREDGEKGYLLDYSISKPESVADRYRKKANYYKLYEQYKPEKYFSGGNNKKEKQRERYTAAPSFNFEHPAKPKSKGYFAQYKAEPIKYEFDYSKGTPRDSSAHASQPYRRLKSKTLFVEPQFQYGFDPINLPQLLDSELAAMASNHNPESEKPGMRKKIYEENWYIKKTSTAGGKPS